VDEGEETPPFAGLHRPDRHLHRDLETVAIDGDEFGTAEQQRTLPRLEEALDPALVRVAVLRGDDPVPEEVPHHLLRPPPERQLRLAVPLDDEATLVDADDGVVRRLQDQPELFLAVAESRLGLLPSRG